MSHDSVLIPLVKVEADIPEEQPEPHPQCHSKKLCDSAEMLGVKTEPEVDIPAEKPQPHPWCDCEEAKKFPDQVQMSEVKIEVDVAEEPPASWMTGDLVQSELCFDTNIVILIIVIKLVYYRISSITITSISITN